MYCPAGNTLSAGHYGGEIDWRVHRQYLQTVRCSAGSTAACSQLESLLALIGGLAVFSLMLLAVASVGGRNFFNHPIPGYVDWIEQVMPLIAFIGISYCQRLGGHIRMDIVMGLLRGRSLWIAEFAGTLLIMVLVLMMIWGSWAHFERSFDWSAP